MKIFSSEQLKAIDAFTIKHESVSSITLMEQAAQACVKRIVKLTRRNEEIYIVCGKGNNGGDGLAIGRILIESGFKVSIFIIHFSEKFTEEAEINYNLLKEKHSDFIIDIQEEKVLKEKFINKNALIIDALLGTGATRAAEGLLADTIEFLNTNYPRIISIDVPSGLFIDESSSGNTKIIHSSLTLTFQFPKAAFLFAENKNYVPEFEILDIGLSEQAIAMEVSTYFYLTKLEISSLLKKRNKFSHKGTYGHALLLAGSAGKSGAAIISATACLRSGAGLLTVHSTKETLNALLYRLPEAMSSEDLQKDYISAINKPENYDAIGFGPGIGVHEDTQQTLKKLLHYYSGKLIIDADGLNILAENKTWLNFLPPNCILTPHIKEFERLTEKADSDFDRMKLLKHFSLTYKCIVILKDAHTTIAMPDGNVFFNSSGNAGLAKGGSGDALTGIILGLLTRGYNAPQASLIGTFIHGYAADICIEKKSMESILISDVIEQLSKAFKKLEKLSAKFL